MLPDTATVPSAERSTHRITFSEPKYCSSRRFDPSQSRIERSTLPESTRRESADHATDVIAPSCPRSQFCSTPVRALHSRTVRSKLPEAIVRPSGEKATLLTVAVWPLHLQTSSGETVDLPELRSVPGRRDCAVEAEPAVFSFGRGGEVR